MVQARVIEAEKAATTAYGETRQIEDPWVGVRGLRDVLTPPYSPVELVRLLERSDTLRQCIDAMVTNIDGAGYTLVPNFDPKKKPDGADEEWGQANAFFEFCHPEESFTQIRSESRFDYETLGYAFWEILRDGKGDIVGISHIPAWTMRLTTLDSEPTEIESLVLDKNTLEFRPIRWRKRFRRFAQAVAGQVVYFKELGDPREIDSVTGEVKPGTDRPATEVLYFRQYHPMTPYGVPRWIGALLAIAGSRAAAEVNYQYFDRKGVPPFIIAVSGGKIGSKTEQRIQRFLRQAQGRDNFHSALVLEAEATDSGPLGPGEQRTKIEIKDLSGSLLKDGLFMQYDERNEEKVRSTFRLPPLYVGRAQDYTRATAEESRDLAESQVFGPERRGFDFIINRRLFPLLGFRYWSFKSLGQTQDNPDSLAQIVAQLSDAGLTVREARRVAEQVLHVDLEDPEGADWLDMPLKVYLARLQAGLAGSTPPEQVVQKLLEIRKAVSEHVGRHGEDH